MIQHIMASRRIIQFSKDKRCSVSVNLCCVHTYALGDAYRGSSDYHSVEDKAGEDSSFQDVMNESIVSYSAGKNRNTEGIPKINTNKNN